MDFMGEPSRTRGTCPTCSANVDVDDMAGTGSPHPVLIYPHQDGRHRCCGTYTLPVEWRAYILDDAARIAEYDSKVALLRERQLLAFGAEFESLTGVRGVSL